MCSISVLDLTQKLLKSILVTFVNLTSADFFTRSTV